jgi:hypothetical protein
MSYTTQGQTQTVFIRNDNVLRLSGLKKHNEDGYENAATVTVTIRSKTGNVGGENFPLAMSYVAGSNGDYLCVLYSTIEWELNEPYVAEITAQADGITSSWEMRLTARKRSISN